METIGITVAKTYLTDNLLVSKFHIRLIKELQVLMVFFKKKKKDFLDWLLYLDDLFDYENICYEKKVGLALYKLSKYALC